MLATRWRFVLIVSIAMAARLSAQSILTVAGGGTDDGLPATSVGLYGGSGLALDRSGNVYLAESSANLVRRIDISTHTITTIAGTGGAGFSGDGGLAVRATLRAAGERCARNAGRSTTAIPTHLNR